MTHPARRAALHATALLALGAAASCHGPHRDHSGHHAGDTRVERRVAVRTVTGEHVPARLRLAGGPWQDVEAYGGRDLEFPTDIAPQDVEVEGERVARVLTGDDAWLVLLENEPVAMEFQLTEEARERVGPRAELLLLQPLMSDASLTGSWNELGRARFDARGRALVHLPPHHLIQVRAAVTGGGSAVLDAWPDVGGPLESQGHFGLLESRATETPIPLGVAPDQSIGPAELLVVDARGEPVVGAVLDRFVLNDRLDTDALLFGEGPSVTTDANGTAAIRSVDDGTFRRFGGLRIRRGESTWILFEKHHSDSTLVLRELDPDPTSAVPLDVRTRVRIATIAEAPAVRAGTGSEPTQALVRESDRPSVQPGTAVFYRSTDGGVAGIAVVDADARLDELVLPPDSVELHLGTADDPAIGVEGAVVSIHGSGGELMHAERFSASIGDALRVPTSDTSESIQLNLVPSVELGRALLGTGLYAVRLTRSSEDGALRVPFTTYELRVVDERGAPLPFAPVWADRFVPQPQLPAFTDQHGRLTLLAARSSTAAWVIQALGHFTLTPGVGELTVLDDAAPTTLVAAPLAR